MRTARYVVQKASGVDGPPIPVDEPCIVVRGQDLLALEMLDHYLELYAEIEGRDPAVWAELMLHRAAIVEWQQEHGSKVADR